MNGVARVPKPVVLIAILFIIILDCSNGFLCGPSMLLDVTSCLNAIPLSEEDRLKVYSTLVLLSDTDLYKWNPCPVCSDLESGVKLLLI